MDKLMRTAMEDAYNFQCKLCDVDVVQNTTELLLRGLATASVDSTTGDMFKSTSSVAVYVKAEMEGYLFRRTETLIHESVDGPDDHSDQLLKASTRPIEFLSDLIDDFVASKRNLLSHVSGFLSSESRLNKIKNFTQKMEMENIWPPDERKATAETILEKIDLKCIFHCPERFGEQDKVDEHRSRCKFRVVNCKNEGCSASFSAIHVEEHDSICPFKVIPCEQLCEEHVMRCEMDRHCATVCPMKIINCPFHHVGCERAFPQGTLDRHCSELFQTHLVYVLQATTRLGSSVIDMNQRLQLLEKNWMLFLATTDSGSVTKVSGVEAEMPLGDVHKAMVQERPLQSTGVTMVNNLYARAINRTCQQIINSKICLWCCIFLYHCGESVPHHEEVYIWFAEGQFLQSSFSVAFSVSSFSGIHLQYFHQRS